MLYYLDTVIVIYAVEGPPADQQRTLNHLTALEQAGHQFVISGLTHTECLVPVLGPGQEQRLADFFRFFHGPNLRTVSLTAAMHTRAASIRGGLANPTLRPASHDGMAWPMHSTSQPRSKRVVMCFSRMTPN